MRATLSLLFLLCAAAPAQEISGELRQWHDVVLTFDGPKTDESATENPFLDYRLDVTFSKGPKQVLVPGY